MWFCSEIRGSASDPNHRLNRDQCSEALMQIQRGGGKKITGRKTSESVPPPLHTWLNNRPAVACALCPPVGREISSSSSSLLSRLFKQNPAPACSRSQLRVPVWGDREEGLTDAFWWLYFTCQRRLAVLVLWSFVVGSAFSCTRLCRRLISWS